MASQDGRRTVTAANFESLAQDGTISCPFCGQNHEVDEVRASLESQGLSTAEFTQLKQLESEGRLGLILTVGIHVTDAITEMGEPTAKFQENFERLEDFLEDIESKTEELEEQVENWQKERDRLDGVKDDIDELKQEQLPDAVEDKLETLGDKVAGQLSTLDDRLAELSYSAPHSGTMQEFELASRARNLNLGDEVLVKGGRSEEDLEIKVRQASQDIGNIVIESKNVKNHQSKHVTQLKDYCEDRDADIGLLVTTDMPSDARTDNIDYWNFGDGILVTRPGQFEAVYLLARYAVQRIYEERVAYEEKSKALEAEQDEAQELLNTIFSEVDRDELQSNLNKMADMIKEQNDDLKKIRDYNERRLEDIREQNREQILTLLEQSLREVNRLDSIVSEEQ